MKTIKIRLGGKCNQNCSFCHSDRSDNYVLNKKLIPFIKYNYYDKINYGGGEPLLYWNTIKYFIDTFPKIRHHIVTNGSLFNDEMLQYTNKYNIRIGLSLNDYTNLSDSVLNLLSKTPHLGYAIVYTGKYTLDQLDAMIYSMNTKLNKSVKTMYNLMHTTSNNDTAYTSKQIREYIDGIDYRIRLFLKEYNQNRYNQYEQVVLNVLDNTIRDKIPGCSKDTFTCVSLDGRLMECSYDKSYIGTIEEGLHYPRYNKLDCYTCKLKGKCITCVKSINNDECYIYNRLNSNLESALNEYNIDKTDLYNTLIERSQLYG